MTATCSMYTQIGSVEGGLVQYCHGYRTTVTGDQSC